MMKRVFLDTNIMLDLAMHRELFDAALAIMNIVTNNKRDFHEFCELPFLTSEEFLLQIDY